MTYDEKKPLYESIMKDVSLILKQRLDESKNKYDGLTRRQRSAIKRGDVGHFKYKSLSDIKKAIREFGHDSKLNIDISDTDDFKIRVNDSGRLIDADAISLFIEGGEVCVTLDTTHEGPLKNLKDNERKDFIKWFNEHIDEIQQHN